MEIQSKLMDGWFSEICSMWPGIALSLEIEQVLYRQKSQFQLIEVFQTKNHGKMLALDGIIQLTQSDEFAYHEMMTHLPLFAHPGPENILVIGGGDGGVLREVCKHRTIQNIDFCELDKAVINVSKTYFPDLAEGFDDPRVSVIIADGSTFVAEQKQQYDVIIVDSPDPVGAAEALFGAPFYQNLKEALKPGGIVAAQGESFFMHPACVVDLVKMVRSLFPVCRYAYFLVPTYPGGNIGVCMGSLGPEISKPARLMPDGFQEQLKYYTPDLHEASFVLPRFATKMFSE